jgi:SAM-dependent methyltransferase
MLRQIGVSFLERSGLTLAAFRAREFVRRFDIGALRRNRRYSCGVGPDGLPLPPTRLITLVAGTPDIDWFLTYGKTSAESIRSILHRNGVRIEDLDAVLDFGCGCGRILRHFPNLESTRLHGCDYNGDLVDWCDRQLPFVAASVNNLEPPLGYQAETFDLVYALSVFTHMPEEMQRAWIGELERVLKPGGYLLITTQGSSFRQHLNDSEREKFDAGSLVVRHDAVAGTNLCAAFHSPRYIEATLLGKFEVLELASVEKGETNGVLQDMTLARKTLNRAGADYPE